MNQSIIISTITILFLVSFTLPAFASNHSFITTWNMPDSDKKLSFNVGTGNNIRIDWGDNTFSMVSSSSVSHMYPSAGTYTVEISGDGFTKFYMPFNDYARLITVNQWGDTKWSSMYEMFANANNMNVIATDTPDLSQVTDMRKMFDYNYKFNADISNWDVSSVTQMNAMFYNAHSFNSDISDWDVSKVTNMMHMFNSAKSFYSDLNDWDVSSVTDMTYMFYGADSFNIQNICSWDLTDIITTNIHADINDCLPVELFCGELESFYVNVIHGTEGVDYLLGTSERDIIYGYGGGDFIYGDAGIDCIYAGDGNDFIQGGKGRDVIYGGEGDDHIRTGKHNDTIYGEGGNDILLATNSVGSNILDGGDGEDICVAVSDSVTFTTINCEITN